MAEKGTYAAYIPLKGVGAELTQNLQYAERMGFYYRQQEDRRRKEKEDRMAMDAKNLGVDLDMFGFKKTGWENVDKPVLDYLLGGKKELEGYAKRKMADPNDAEAIIKYEKILNSAKVMKSLLEGFRGKRTLLDEGIASGDLSGVLNKPYVDKLNKALLQGSYKFFNDKNGDLQFFADGDKNNEHDPEYLLINAQGYYDGIDMPEWEKGYTIKKVVDQIYKDYNFADVTDPGKGPGKYYNTIREKGFNPESVKILDRDISDLLGSSMENIKNPAISIFGDELEIPVDEAGLTDLKNRMRESVIARWEYLKEDKKDFSAENAAKSLAHRQYIDGENLKIAKAQEARAAKKAKEEDKKTTTGGNGVEIITNEDGETTTNLGRTTYGISETIGLTSKNGADVIDQISLTPILPTGEDGQREFKVEVSGLRTSTVDGDAKPTTTTFKTSNDIEISKFLPQTTNPETEKPFRNVQELYQFLNRTLDSHKAKLKQKALDGLPEFTEEFPEYTED